MEIGFQSSMSVSAQSFRFLFSFYFLLELWNSISNTMGPRTCIFYDCGPQKSQQIILLSKEEGILSLKTVGGWGSAGNVNKQICLHPSPRTEVKLGNCQYHIQADGTLVLHPFKHISIQLMLDPSKLLTCNPVVVLHGLVFVPWTHLVMTGDYYIFCNTWRRGVVLLLASIGYRARKLIMVPQ